MKKTLIAALLLSSTVVQSEELFTQQCLDYYSRVHYYSYYTSQPFVTNVNDLNDALIATGQEGRAPFFKTLDHIVDGYTQQQVDSDIKKCSSKIKDMNTFKDMFKKMNHI